MHGRYEPLGRIRARDRHHDSHVALRITPMRDGLREEARALLRMRPHRGLPAIRDGFPEDDGYVLVSDWVEGTTLATLVAETGDPGLPATSVLRYLADAAVALDHLHAHDPPIAHGDVTPANLVLTPSGDVVLAGLALAPGEPGPYAAPEGGRSPAADVYALAATAVALVTGRPPLDGESVWEGIPPEAIGPVERALRGALEPNPSRRPARATDLVERLRAWLASELPTGTVTFLLTDVEGSTRLWETEPDAMRRAMVRHHTVVEGRIEQHHGRLPRDQGEGDARFAAFARASDAVACALEIQRAFADEPWPTTVPLRVRIGIHSGEAELREGNYFGSAVARTARLRGIGHGGQVLLSRATSDLVGDALPDGASLVALGTHRLKDLSRPEDVFQLAHPDIPADFAPLTSLDARPHNLPVELTSFIGRDDEMLEVTKLLSTARLLTITGPGGAGKTRLALQVAADLIEEHAAGVWLADLAPLTQSELVAQRVASALGLREQPGRTVTDTLVDHVAGKTLLVVLDNCEHVIRACTELCGTLLRASQGLRVLATSRTPLGVPGEALYPLPPFPVPGEAVYVETLALNESVRLFVDRAQLSKPAFSLTPDNAEAVARICRRLDGIPLAIELAAARVRMMTPQEIAQRLDDRFRLLTGGAPGGLPHHRTLEATIDWSYELMSEEERILFRRLAVFAGGFTLDAAQEVCGEGLED